MSTSHFHPFFKSSFSLKIINKQTTIYLNIHVCSIHIKCILKDMCTHTHTSPFRSSLLLLLLSQALIIECQVKITSSSHTWLGQKQLLQRSNVFFTRLFTLIRQCAAKRNALDSKWQSFALNKERKALGTSSARSHRIGTGYAAHSGVGLTRCVL